MDIENRIYTFDELKSVYTKYITKESDLRLIEKAYLFANEKHKLQKRKSGDPYITHCIGVAYILAQLQSGPQTIIAGLLHDTIEDANTTEKEIEENFGPDILMLVNGLTKITRLSDYKNVEFTSENHRKIFVAMAKDVRVIIIKLADRLHNMRTLQFQPEYKQKSISSETLEVYAPIAHRLGLFQIQSELEDLSLWYLDNSSYVQIEKKMDEFYFNVSDSIKQFNDELSNILTNAGIPFYIKNRVKSVYSIYKKMNKKNYSFEQIYDIMALRIITETEVNCYEILGYVHANYKPVSGRFKDYIAMPKPNMYQSLHTTIISNSGHVFEIQIRTKSMDETADSGVAAHWRYKENSNYDAKKEQEEIENQLHWFKDFVSMTTEEGTDTNAKEYVDNLSHDIFDANVYVFTPKGSVICLPTGSTPIDFAYRIHTDLGDHLQGAKINGILVPLSKELNTGDIVEVITNKNCSPNSEWLNIAHTNSAKSRIRKYLTKINQDYLRDDMVKKGRTILNDSIRLRKLSIDITKIINKKVLSTFKCANIDDVLELLGLKKITPEQVLDASDCIEYSGKKSVDELMDLVNKRTIKKNTTDAILLESGESVMYSMANCCLPIPGDEIIGFVTTGQGVKIHRKDCPNMNKNNVDSRQINVKWNPDAIDKNEYPADLLLEAHDRSNLLIDVLNCMATANLTVVKINAKLHSQTHTTSITLKTMVKNNDQLGSCIHQLTQIKSIYEVKRVIH